MEMQGTSQFESKGELDIMTRRIHQNLPLRWLHWFCSYAFQRKIFDVS